MRTFKKILFKKALIIFIILIAIKANAQQDVDKVAVNGHNGIYIYNIFTPASAAHPDGEVVGFRLDRKERKEGNWQTIQKFSTPATYEELNNNFELAKSKVFDYRPATAYTIAQVWPIFKKTFNYDSIGAYIAQQAMATAFNIILVDTTAKRDLTYQYKLVQVKRDGTDALSYISDPVSTKDAVVANKPKKFSRSADANVVKMEWRSKITGKLPEGLVVHRSDGLNMPFYRYPISYDVEQRGDTLIYRVEDQQIKKEQLYQYTITPVNVFGGGGVTVSDTIVAAVIDEFLLTPKVFNVKSDSVKNNITLNWSFERPDFISAVSIYRSTDYENGYERISATSGYNYIDNTVVAGQKYYYYLIVTDMMGKTSQRGVRAYGLVFKEKKSGVATNVRVSAKNNQNVISWTDLNNDSRGYYVFRNNQFDGELKAITGMIYRDENAKGEFSFTDTAKNLSGKIGYAIVSENLSNVRSNFSNVVYTQNATVLAAAPTIIDFRKTESNIHLFWQDLSNPKSATGYNIYRKIGNADFVKINKLTVLAYKNSYKDSILLNDQEVSYKIKSINSAGIESLFSDEMIVQNAQMVYPPVALKSFYDKDKKALILQWQPSQSDVAKYEIYRYIRDAEPVKIGDVDAKTLTYTDLRFDDKQNNYYFVKTVGVNGKLSLPSSEVYKVATD